MYLLRHVMHVYSYKRVRKDVSISRQKGCSKIVHLSPIGYTVRMSYRTKFSPLLSPEERKFFQRLSTPSKIQDYLDTLPINFELKGETYFSPRRTIREATAHCFEGAVLAAAALAWHGQEPLLVDLKTAEPDIDHVVTLFKSGTYWGAISKTNHPMLRWRDPVYKSIRELAMSYFHEYFFSPGGKKTLRSYSRPFSLARFDPRQWLTAEEDLLWLVETLDEAPHLPTVENSRIRTLRKVSAIEIKASDLEEWETP